MRSNTEAPPLVLDHARHEDVVFVSVRSPEVSENVNACDEHLRFAPPELKVVVPYVDGRSVFQDFNDRWPLKVASLGENSGLAAVPRPVP